MGHITQGETKSAAEVNNDHDQILGKRLRTPENASEKEQEEELVTSSSNNSSVEENASENIWHEWQKFLNDPLRRNLYEPLSPEKNNVIWCGKFVARRSSLPEDLYARLQVEVESVPAVAINHDLHEIVDRVLDADDLDQYEDVIEELRIQKNQLKENKLQIDFLTGILERLKDIYEDDEDKIEHSEPCLNYDLALPCLKVSVQMIRKNGYKVTTFPGEEELEEMKKQQQIQGLTDNRHKYKADGIVRYDSSNEILVMETSAAYNNTPSEKCSFDHYKAKFGLLAMIKTLSDKYQYASFEVLKKLKLHFIHVHGKYGRAMLDNVDTQKRYLCHAALQETIETIKMLEASHKDALRMMRHKPMLSVASLQSVVDSVIIRLTENKHSQLLNGQGLQSLPESPK
ncbi:hypothetical protein G6F18_007647 [Rhizopus arrhizus]|nr:hypothetical protein G6F18_007647 [Rhizopus arrhizus]KAG1398231.1 hypothetical protein G6F58_011363 [Rhizopus delemar]